MSNGPKLSLGQTVQLGQIQTIGVYLAPLMTPVLRRSRAERPRLEAGAEAGVEAGVEDDTPWRSKITGDDSRE
jgi:hypothetical protein